MKNAIVEFFNDDKNLVIVCATVVCLCLVFKNEVQAEQLSVISSIVSGLFGVAVGRSLGKKSE